MGATTDGPTFGILDWTVLLLYFVGITLFGLWLARRIRSSNSYFLGDRQLPWWIMIGQAFGTGTHAENPVAQAGASLNNGFATIWYQWKNMLVTPFYWLIAPWYRRSERTTVGEIVEDRYGRGLALFYSLFAIAFFVFCQGAMLKGAGKVIAAATGGQIISPNGVIIAMTIAFVLYSFFGGLIASAYTDFIQGFMIIILSFMLIPVGLREVGGFTGLHNTLPPEFFHLYSEVSGLDAFTIGMLAINGIIGVAAQPHMVSLSATGRTERAGRIGQTYGAFVKRFCTIGWAFTGLIVAAMIVQRGDVLPDQEEAFGYASLHLLLPGMTGLLVACVLAANMSTCSNFMVNTGALFTRNIYKEYLVPDADDRKLLTIGRLSGLALTGLSILFALSVTNVLHAFLFTETIAALMGIMFVGGILWKRANRWGAWAATIGAFTSYYFFNYLMTCRPLQEDQSFSTLRQGVAELWHCIQTDAAADFLRSGEIQLIYSWKAGPFGVAMLVGFGLFVIISLLTRREPAAQIEKFFDNMARSTDTEAAPDSSASKPLARDRGEELIMVDAVGWLSVSRWRPFWSRYREDVVGFVLAWGAVAALIAIAWLLMQIGRE